MTSSNSGVTVRPRCAAVPRVTAKVMASPSDALASATDSVTTSLSSRVTLVPVTSKPSNVPPTEIDSSPSNTSSSFGVSSNVSFPLL